MSTDSTAPFGKSTASDPLILIVDDLPENLAVLGNILRDEGYQIAVASSGPQAIKIASSRNPDLILLDIAMPDMDGLTTSGLLKGNPETADIPVIFLTARTDSGDVLKGFKAGAVDYITKPFKAGELLVRVSTHIELKRSRDQIAKQKAALDNLLETRNKLFSVITHDLKSPFAGLITLINVMIECFDTYSREEFKESLSLIKETSDNIHSLMQNLTNWAKLNTNAIEYKPESVNLTGLIKSTFSPLSINYHKKCIGLNINITEDCTLNTDPDLLRVVIYNLLSNAGKFSHPGSTVSVDYTVDEAGPCIAVTDSGTGMSSGQLQSLFNGTSVASSPGTANESGSGIGLLLCREMIEKAGGRISATSEPGKGSRFNIRLNPEN